MPSPRRNGRNQLQHLTQTDATKGRLPGSGQNFWMQTNGPQGGDGIALARNSIGHVFVGTQGGGVFRSIDNAETWTGINNGLTATNVRALAISPVDHIFAGTFGGVFRSTDNGDHWIAVNNGLEFPFVISLAVNADGDIFAGTFEGGGVYRSTDDGENWTLVDNGLTNTYVTALAINSGGHIFAATFGGGAFRSTDNGDSWTQTQHWSTECYVSFPGHQRERLHFRWRRSSWWSCRCTSLY